MSQATLPQSLERTGERREPVPGPPKPDAPPRSESAPIEEKRNKPWKKVAIVAGVVAVLVLIGAVIVPTYLHSLAWQSTDDAFIDGQVVNVAPKVSGYVDELLVTDNQHVKAGDRLLHIDPRDYQARLDAANAEWRSAQAQLEQVKRNVEVLNANVAAADAEVKASQANAENAKQQAERIRNIGAEAASGQERTSAVAQERSTAADVVAKQGRLQAAKAQLDTNDAAVKSAEAQVNLARTRVDQAQLDLSHTWVVAPMAGKVTRRSVEKGDYLQPGQQLLAIVPDDVWVTANYKETQLNTIRVGQPAVVRVDAYGGREFKAHVDSIQSGTGARFSLLPPENATGNYVKVVQRVPVKIVFDEDLPEDLTIAPGMSVVPEVKVK
ncbi:MAG: HlyD family secretion protein [Tepidisphaeraceae bacterium]